MQALSCDAKLRVWLEMLLIHPGLTCFESFAVPFCFEVARNKTGMTKQNGHLVIIAAYTDTCHVTYIVIGRVVLIVG